MIATENSRAGDDRWECVLVDNSEINIGVASSWNRGVDRVLASQADWLVLLSTTIRFNKGGIDFLDGLEKSSARMVSGIGTGWHLHAISRDVLERIGEFDPLFNPAYYEDNDYLYRYYLEYGEPAGVDHDWLEVDYKSLGDAHSLRFNHVAIDINEQRKKYENKWGGDPSRELWRSPYNK
jgi:hypothetical protein